jgi:hypothetical protein
MKLECYWILQNLACCSTEDIKFLLGNGAENGIPQDELLRKLSVEINRVRSGQYKDRFTLGSLVDVLSNIAMTNTKCRNLVLTQTSIEQALLEIIVLHDKLDQRLLERMIMLAKELSCATQANREQAKNLIGVLKVALKLNSPSLVR